MQLATWNVNSIRARLDRVLAWLESRRPDVCCLQETKCVDGEFPRAEIEALGYAVETYGQPTYNGVAILSREPITNVVRGLPDDGPDADRRLIVGTVGDLEVWGLYVVNGQSVGTEKFDFKLAWLERLRAFVESRFDPARKVVLCGDFNVAPDDRDVWDPAAWKERILCSTPEREALRRLLDVGFQDAFRAFHEEGGHYSWWDYRRLAFPKNRGLRIDHVFVSPAALEACRGVEIDREERKGKKPSDHAPVVATFAG